MNHTMRELSLADYRKFMGYEINDEQIQRLTGIKYAHLPKDAVNQPAHYARWKMQPIEFIAINELPFWLANVIKYCCRYDAKDGLQDLYKARSYLEMQIRRLEGHERWWEKPVSEERSLKRGSVK